MTRRAGSLLLLLGGAAACSASGSKPEGPARTASASASTVASAAPPRTPMAVDEAMAALRDARNAAEKTPGKRPSPGAFALAAEDLRAAGVRGEVAVVHALGAPQLVGDRTGVVPVSTAENATLVFETTDDPGPRLLPRRLIARGLDLPRVIRVDADSFVVQGRASALLFPALDAAPIEAAAVASRPTKSGWVAFFGADEGWVLDANTGKEILPRTRGLDATLAGWTHDEQWLAVCDPSHGDKPVVVVDVATRKELFRGVEGASVSACAIDHASRELAIVYYDDKPQKLTLEAWDLDTGKRRTTKVIGKTYVPEMLLEMETDTHSVTVVSAPYGGSRSLHGRYDLHTGAALQVRKDASPPKRPKPAGSTNPLDPVAGIPVGEPDLSTDFSDAVWSLATPGSKLVGNYHDRASWLANGVLSQDRASLALLEDDVRGLGTAPAMLVVDVATMKVRHRIGLRATFYQWAKAAFLDSNTAVARLEWHYWLIDASTGAILGSAEHDMTAAGGAYESPSLVGPNIAVIGTRLFDVRRGLPEGQSREIAPPYTSQAVQLSGKDDGLAYEDGDRYSLSIAKDGAVIFTRPAVPDWLVCIVKDEVLPYEACGAWYPAAPQDR